MTEEIKSWVDFGAPEAFGAHVFRVEIGAGRQDAVRIVEDYGYQGGENGRPYEEARAELRRPIWTGIAEAARRDFNARLKAKGQGTGRWKPGRTLVDRLLGKELCVLAWAAEDAKPEQLPVIASRWAALRPEERWWLFSMTAAEAGRPEDGARGWRMALHFALADGEPPSVPKPRKKLKSEDEEMPLFRMGNL